MLWRHPSTGFARLPSSLSRRSSRARFAVDQRVPLSGPDALQVRARCAATRSRVAHRDEQNRRGLPPPVCANGFPHDADAHSPPGTSCRSASNDASPSADDVTSHAPQGPSSAASTCKCQLSGPALLLLGLTAGPHAGSALLAGLTAAAAAGGPVFGVLLDRSSAPGRLLALALGGYAGGIALVAATFGHLPLVAVVALAVVTGLLNPAVAGGWTAQLPAVAGRRLQKASRLDALTFTAAALVGPGLAGLLGGPVGLVVAVVLVAAAVPAAWILPGKRPQAKTRLKDGFEVLVRKHAAEAGDMRVDALVCGHRHGHRLLPPAGRGPPPRAGRRRAVADRPGRGVAAGQRGVRAPPAAVGPGPHGLAEHARPRGRLRSGREHEHRHGAGRGGRHRRGRRRTAAHGVVRDPAPRGARARPRAGFHDGGQREDHRAGGRGGLGRAAGDVVAAGLPQRRGGGPDRRRDDLSLQVRRPSPGRAASPRCRGWCAGR
jgi:hypothetical protein